MLFSAKDRQGLFRTTGRKYYSVQRSEKDFVGLRRDKEYVVLRTNKDYVLLKTDKYNVELRTEKDYLVRRQTRNI